MAAATEIRQLFNDFYMDIYAMFNIVYTQFTDVNAWLSNFEEGHPTLNAAAELTCKKEILVHTRLEIATRVTMENVGYGFKSENNNSNTHVLEVTLKARLFYKEEH